MRFYFQIALILTAATCEANENEDMNDFMAFASVNGKHYQNVEDFQKREKIFKKNHAEVKRMNRHKGLGSRKDAAKFADNYTSDMEDSEYLNMLGVPKSKEDDDCKRLLDEDNTFEKGDGLGGRHLLADTPIDWVAAGRMHDIKTQGDCGSCWAFAAATTLEAMEAIEYDTYAVRLSEQQAIDCTEGSCVYGGFYAQAWEYWQNNGGAMLNYDYGYKGKDQNCKTPDAQDEGWSFVKGYGKVEDLQAGNSLNALDRLSQGPLAVAISAGNKCWRWYDGGIMGPDDDCYKGGLDHAVVLVAYTPAVTGNDEEICTIEETTSCRRASRWERRLKVCWGDDEFLAPNKKGNRPNRRCCHTHEEENCESDGGSTPAYWTIQNSWGNQWGDNGFIHMEVSEGDGTSGINRCMEWVDVERGPGTLRQ